MRFLTIFAAVALAPFSLVTAVQATTTTYNTTPTAGWPFGSGNNYAPANSALLKDLSNEIALRMHQTFQPAPASDNAGVYSFALGTTPISFDWSLTSSAGSALQSSLITVTNVNTGGFVSYNPFFVGNDNQLFGSTYQNSARLTFAAFSPVGFNPNVNGLYKVNFTTDFGNGAQGIDVFAKVGAVPEPTTWALFIGGFGVIGLTMRRRAAKQTLSLA